jgi:hypothetical protein
LLVIHNHSTFCSVKIYERRVNLANLAKKSSRMNL